MNQHHNAVVNLDPQLAIPLCTDTGIQWVRPIDLAAAWTQEQERTTTSRLRAIALGDEAGIAYDAPVRTADELARCDRGSIGILVLFMGLVLFALVALVWNTGEVTTAKIEAQTAADSAAYSSAVWTSRVLNITAATNMQIMRDGSAAAVATAMYAQSLFWFIQAVVMTVIDAVRAVIAGVSLASAIAANIAAFGTLTAAVVAAAASFASALISLARSLADLALASSIIDDIGGFEQPVKDISALTGHINALGAYQEQWIRAVPMLVAAQEAQLEDYYDCDITLSHGALHGLDSAPGPVSEYRGQIRPPLRTGRSGDVFIPMGLRFLYDMYGKKGSNAGWYGDKRLKAFVRIPVKPNTAGFAIFHAAAAASFVGFLLASVHGSFHTLTSAESIDAPVPVPGLEYGPAGSLAFGSNWPDYTVVAVARKRTSNDQSLQLPARPLDLMAANLFGPADNVRPVAYATAETFNGVDGLLGSFELGGFNLGQELFALYPWRMWTDWGWQWTPRLTHGGTIFGGDATAAFLNEGYQLTPGTRTVIMH